jgi:hypothetical protein
MLTNIKIAIALIALFGSGYAGWKLKDAADAMKERAVAEETKKIHDDFTKLETNVATTLEDKLKELRANEKIIYKESQKIVDRPVYHNDCLDADGLSLINRARTIEADPGKSAK